MKKNYYPTFLAKLQLRCHCGKFSRNGFNTGQRVFTESAFYKGIRGILSKRKIML